MAVNYHYLKLIQVLIIQMKVRVYVDHEKNHKFLDKSIYFWLAFESYCFHGHAWNDNKCSILHSGFDKIQNS